MKTPLTLSRIRGHLAYSWWKYVLLLIAVVMGGNLIFTVSRPQPKENEKVELYIYAYGNETPMNEYLERVHTSELSDQKLIDTIWLTPDEASGLMVLSTHLMAGEGDLVVLPREIFNTYAGQGLFEALEDLPGVMEAADAAGTNLERSWRKNTDSGERRLYGIPVRGMLLFSDSLYSTDEYYLSLRVYNGNEAASRRLLGMILRDWLPGASEVAGIQQLCAPSSAVEQGGK